MRLLAPWRVALRPLLLLPILACATTAPHPADRLVIAIEAAPSTLDPRFATEASASRIDDLVFEGLTRRGPGARSLPALAERWETPDDRTFVFHLRPGARFHDGSSLTSADVKATYEAILDPAMRSPKREMLAAVAAVEAPDPARVVFRLRAPFAPFLDATRIGILPATLARDPAAVGIMGSGPFRLAAIEPGERIVLERNPLYRGGPPPLAGVTFRIIPDDVVRALELVRGTVGFIDGAVEPDVVPWLDRHPDVTVRIGPGTSFQYLGFNFRDPRLADRRVRRAIAYAIDREAIIHHLLKDLAVPATGLLSPDHWAYEGRVRTYRHDPARARTLLDAAGYPDPDGPGPRPRMRLSYKTSTQALRRRIAEAFQEQLATVGIALDVRSYEWATLYADIRRGNFQLYSLAWVGVSDPDVYYLILHSTMRPPRGYNRGGYANPTVDRLAVAARRTLEPARRRALYARLQRLVAADLPFVPLWWEKRVVIHTSRLHGFTLAPDGNLASLARARLR